MPALLRVTTSPFYCGIILCCFFLAGCDIGPKDEKATIPDIPFPTAPQDGSIDHPNAVYLEWTEAHDATRYHVQLSFSPDFTDVAVDNRNILDNLTPVPELQIDSTYYWRVRAINDVGLSDWSSTWSFSPSSVARLPSAPVLAVPPDGQGGLETSVEFKWHREENSRFYEIQASLEDDFFSQEALMVVADTSQTVSQLVYEYWYFWRVRGQNAAGFGPWSPSWLILIKAAD